MNLLIHGFHEPEDLKIIKRLIANNSIQQLVHVCAQPNVLNPLECHIPIESMDFYQVGNGLYNLQGLPPLDGALLESMLPIEAIVMKQMDRLEIYDPQYTNYSNRRTLYLKHLRFWNYMLTSRRIDLFIGSNVPHEVYDFVILGLCRLHLIDTHFLFQSAIPDTVHHLTDYTDFTPGLKPVFRQIKSLYQGVPDDGIVLSGKLQREWMRQLNNNIPFYMNQPVRCHVNNIILEQEHNQFVSNPDLTKPYVYFPLHFQPEITTSPLGGQFCDQATAITLLAHCLPKTVSLIVKEHPMQNWVGRGRGFYHNIIDQSPNVILVPKGIPSHYLINNSIAVSTITGTAGWEALFRKKPVLLFGNIFYQDAPGVFKIKTEADCNNAINQIVNNGFKYNEKNLKLYLLALDSLSIECVIDSAYRVESKIDPLKLEDNLFNHLYETIDKVKVRRCSVKG
jgi:hypothetical protein